MGKENLAQARLALNEFMLAMNAWECRFFRAKREALDGGRDVKAIDDEARDSLVAIFGKWVCPDKANEGRLVDLRCGDPPTYDPASDVEDSTEMRGNKALFTVRQTGGLQSSFRFTLIAKDNEWKIENKELLNHREKWQRSIL